MNFPTPSIRTAGLFLSMLALPACLLAQIEEPVVRKLPEAFQQKVQFLNPEILPFLPVRETNASCRC